MKHTSITIKDIQAKIESSDFDIDRGSNVEVAEYVKAACVDILNWMIQHNITGLAYNYDDNFDFIDAISGLHNNIFGGSALVRDRQMVIMQGVPGSGKTEIAKILAKSISAKIVSNNDHMLDESGKYFFDASRLQEVADKCYNAAEKAVEEGWSVIVDNTNIDYREAGSFIELAMHHGYRVQIVRCERSSAECISENVHNVPEGTIIRRHSMMQSLVN